MLTCFPPFHLQAGMAAANYGDRALALLLKQGSGADAIQVSMKMCRKTRRGSGNGPGTLLTGQVSGFMVTAEAAGLAGIACQPPLCHPWEQRIAPPNLNI